MKIIKRQKSDILREEAHGGSGMREVYVDKQHLKGQKLEMMTRGYLPAGQTFDWHDQPSTEEIMVVMSGKGEVHDEDGVYPYEPGDVFIFPADTQHKIHNPSNNEHEMIFVRIKV